MTGSNRSRVPWQNTYEKLACLKAALVMSNKKIEIRGQKSPDKVIFIPLLPNSSPEIIATCYFFLLFFIFPNMTYHRRPSICIFFSQKLQMPFRKLRGHIIQENHNHKLRPSQGIKSSSREYETSQHIMQKIHGQTCFQRANPREDFIRFHAIFAGLR